MYLFSLYTPVILCKALEVFTLNIQTQQLKLFTLKTAASENIDSLKSGNGAIEKWQQIEMQYRSWTLYWNLSN